MSDEKKDFTEAVDNSLEKTLRAEEQEFEGFKNQTHQCRYSSACP